MGIKENLARARAPQPRGRSWAAARRASSASTPRASCTARERIELLLDPGSFVELDRFKTHRCADFGMEEKKIPGDGVVTGYGTIDGRLVFVFSQDFTVFGGCLSGAFAEKICKVMDLAMKVGAPVIGLNDSGGARIQEGVVSLAGYADIFLRNMLASGVVPQISAIMGPCAGGAVYSPAITDFIFMVEEHGYMFITGPDVIKTVTHEEVTQGGPRRRRRPTTSAAASPTSTARDDAETPRAWSASCSPSSRRTTSRTRPSCRPTTRRPRATRRSTTLVPDNPNKPYDMHEVIRAVVDDGYFFEVQRRLRAATSSSASRASAAARSASSPTSPPYLAGVPRHRRLGQGGALRPLLRLLQHPARHLRRRARASCPAPTQEYGGIIKHGAKLLYAFCEATVPKVTVITRKAYGGAYDVMSSKHIRGDVNFAYPTAEIAVMGPDGAVNIIFRNEIAKATDAGRRARRASSPSTARRSPTRTRPPSSATSTRSSRPRRPARGSSARSRCSQNKRDTNPPKKHGNIPL